MEFLRMKAFVLIGHWCSSAPTLKLSEEYILIVWHSDGASMITILVKRIHGRSDSALNKKHCFIGLRTPAI